MGSMTLEIDERYPPYDAVNDARVVARENAAGRVKVANGDGWEMQIDVPRPGGSMPPSDVPMDEWDDVPGLNKSETDAFVADIKNWTNGRQVNREQLSGGQYERITVKYD